VFIEPISAIRLTWMMNANARHTNLGLGVVPTHWHVVG